jgi:hypothetical protein
MKNKYEIWVATKGHIGADCVFCGSVPAVGSRLNGKEVLLVVPQPANLKQFLAVIAR